ncbi:hypothetical protein F5Y09DRAFT_347835 [Xylaria sp. FL1042]|nr:hypothetical protein F5Y09DRAFT_347835 [Xylaria sp. FL1042]
MGYGRDGSPGTEGHNPVAPPSSPNLASPPTNNVDGAGEEATSVIEGDRYWRHVHEFYERNIGLFLVFSAQTFGSVMNTAAKLLTAGDSSNQFHALHIIFVRMLSTSILGMLYMWYKKVPSFPFGPQNMIPLLVMRGTAGFVGLFGLYYSLSYLEISDATAISFLVPTWTALLCYVWLKEPYRIQEAMSGFISLAGVLFIARPAFLFGRVGAPSPDARNATMMAFIVDGPQEGSPMVGSPSSPQRTLAVVCSIAGTFAAATAYSTIRVIGKRVHSLISVNYFAGMSTIASGFIILVHPDLDFMLPTGATQWILLLIIGVAGFLLQFLLTEGLQREKGGRATNMTYFQMVLALIIERVIWGTTPPVLSLVGSALIISAAIWLSLQKAKPNKSEDRTALVDEETSLLRPGRRQNVA